MRSRWAISFCAIGLGVLVGLPLRAQDAQQESGPSVVGAAQAARERIASSKVPAPVVDDDTLTGRSTAPTSAASPPSRTGASPEASASGDTDCFNPAGAEALNNELQEAQQEREQLQHELEKQAPVISDHDLDLTHFHPGSSGIAVGALPLQESQPQAPARIESATLEQKIASLQKSLQLACSLPETAAVQKKLDAIEGELKWSQRQLTLDQDTVYSNPAYPQDRKSKAQLAAEQEYVDSLAAQKAQLEEQLATIQANSSSAELANQDRSTAQAGSMQPQAKPQPQ